MNLIKKYIAVLIFVSIFLTCKAQETFYSQIQLGNNQIGFCDTVIYDTTILYKQYGYEGSKPIFCKIWFPEENSDDSQYLKFGDFNKTNVPDELSVVHKELSSQMDEISVRDGVAFDISTGDSLDYGNTNVYEILAQIKLIDTKSHASKLASKLDYPVIVYHHGAQGLSYENSIMAEYFASRGYIFISANFHLPFGNLDYGSIPYNPEKPNSNNQSSAKQLIKFAKSISKGNEIYFIGHSWGAQEGWCFLNDSMYVSAFVSMETTIEYKTDSLQIKEMWPEVYTALRTKKNKFSIPILLFAAQDENMSFNFFKGISNKDMIYASYLEPFSHNSYTSLLMMRYFLNNNLKQPDTDIMLTQIKGYAAHLDLIFSFLQNQKKGNRSYLEKFRMQFIITQE
ncbi:MAG: hypothetical protein RLO12_07040 [Fulvivirga sp.]